MKKQVCTVLSVVCLIALAGCGTGSSSDSSGPGSLSNASMPAGPSESAGLSGAGAGDSSGSPVKNPMSGAGTAADPDGDAVSDSGADSPSDPSNDTFPNSGDSSVSDSGKDTVVWQLRIVDGAESGSLILAGPDAGQVYSLSAGSIPVYLDGEPADAASLQDGMMTDIVFDGMIMETYPGQFGAVQELRAYSQDKEQTPDGSSYFDLCGLYLQVLNDLWDRDPGLNSDVLHISLDLSQAPGNLTEGEKSAIAWIFAGQHGTDALTLSYEELVQQGYLTEASGSGDHKLYQWEDGILFTVTPVPSEGVMPCCLCGRFHPATASPQWKDADLCSLPVLEFNVDKWRSPLGAYYFTDCFLYWPEAGTWSGYEIGSELIS